MLFCRLRTFLKINFFSKIRVSNSLDLDQDQHSVGPDLDSNCLQRLSADDTGRQRVNFILIRQMKLADRYGDNPDLLGQSDTYEDEINQMRKVGSPPGQAGKPGSRRHDAAYVDQ